MPTTPEQPLRQVLDALRSRDRFVVVSHARPDGDATGSQLALGLALRHLGKHVRMVSRDRPQAWLLSFAEAADVAVADRVEGAFDAAVVLECGALDRTGIAGLERYFVINVDHHRGNALYGAVNWFDETAAACGEMVHDIVAGLGVPLTPAIATFLYVAILTDTGSFRHANITARTFDICRRLAAAGVSPAAVAARVYQQAPVGTLRLTGELLRRMELAGAGRVAVLHVDDALLHATGCEPEDLDGMINLPLQAREVRAAVLFKALGGEIRVSLRSKGAIDVRAVAAAHGGGGHRNAAGCELQPPLERARPGLVAGVVAAVDAETGA